MGALTAGQGSRELGWCRRCEALDPRDCVVVLDKKEQEVGT